MGGIHFERLWRGVTDHHIVEASFIASAEARKLHTLATEQAESFAAAGKLVPMKGAATATTQAEIDETDEPLTDEDGKPTTPGARREPGGAAVAAARRDPARRAQGAGDPALQGAGRDERRAIVGKRRSTPPIRTMLRVTSDGRVGGGHDLHPVDGRVVVEPRREFIQDNALNVANLDV